MTTLVWLFVALVISQTYTANLTSMLTARGLEPTVNNIETLQSSNAIIGYSSISFVARYLEDVLEIMPVSSDLKSRKTGAVFLEVAEAKIFLAKYCKGFTVAGPTYKVGGLGFVILRLTSFTFHLINNNDLRRKLSNSGCLSKLVIFPYLNKYLLIDQLKRKK